MLCDLMRIYRDIDYLWLCDDGSLILSNKASSRRLKRVFRFHRGGNREFTFHAWSCARAPRMTGAVTGITPKLQTCMRCNSCCEIKVGHSLRTQQFNLFDLRSVNDDWLNILSTGGAVAGSLRLISQLYTFRVISSRGL